MTMEDLLESLIKKAKVESEEAHRQLVAAHNGMAGLHIMKGEVTLTGSHFEGLHCVQVSCESGIKGMEGGK